MFSFMRINVTICFPNAFYIINIQNALFVLKAKLMHAMNAFEPSIIIQLANGRFFELCNKNLKDTNNIYNKKS